MVVVTVCVLLIIVRRMDGFDGIRLLANLVWFLVAFGLFFGCFLLSFFLTYNKKERKKKEGKRMTIYENHDTEYKREYISGVNKEVVAFANTNGGTLYIGVSYDGTICGVENPDDTMLRAAGSLKDSIAPDIMPFVNVKAIKMDGKDVVEITVSTGTNRPYYLKEKGLKPTGVYVRKGSSSQPMTDEGIRNMIIRNSGRSYESCRSLKQELTFDVLKSEMQKKNIEIGEAQMRTLKLIGEDGLYTNLALLLSDQCEFTTKIAIFQGTDKELFRDRREFGGSILKQMEDVYQFLDLNNRTKATFYGLDRTDIRDYSEEAIKEAWLNCVVHRDYSYSGSTIINVYEDRIEFVTLGGLVPGLTIDSIFLGISQSRNPNLAALFYRLHLIESYGTGIGKIRRGYKDFSCEPVFETAPGVFRVTLPNRNEQHKEEMVSPRDNKSEFIGTEKKMIMDFAEENGSISRKQTEELLGVGTTKAFRLLRELCASEILKVEGSGKNRRYVLTQKP